MPRIAFDDLGLPGQWADVVNIATKSQAQIEKWQELAPEKVASEVITAWHILDPETGAELPPPSEADWKCVPIGVMAATRRSLEEQAASLNPKS